VAWIRSRRSWHWRAPPRSWVERRQPCENRRDRKRAATRARAPASGRGSREARSSRGTTAETEIASDPEEIEAKFSFEDGEALRDWFDEAFPVGGGEGWRTHQITDTYFDTADDVLEQAGYGARLRSVGPTTTLTIKADIEVSEGLHRRVELEAPATRTLEPDKWPDSEARSQLIDVVGGRRLIERFVVGQQRRERAIEVDGTRVVASIDEGEVEYIGLPSGELRVFELELLTGDPAALRRIARRVNESDLVQAQDNSKMELAADLAKDESQLAKHDRWSDGARKLLRRHLMRMLERESETRGGDAMALKQMRVATRRMRATWRVFGGAFAGGHARHFDQSLRHVAGLLGAVRDLDVLLETVEGNDDVASMASSWRARRNAAFDDLTRHLDSSDYERFVDDFLEGTGAHAHWSAGKRADDRVEDVAPARLEKAHADMLEAAANANGSNEAAVWHELRITAKRMRYALEAFRDVSDEPAATDFIEALRTLQDNLGEMNDASVAAREAASWLTSDIGSDAPPAQRVAVAGYIGDKEAAVAHAREAFAKAWPPVAAAELPHIG
jgi:triphosphatase